MDTLDWLLNSDPAIRWQAMRDLTGASVAEITSERARIPIILKLETGNALVSAVLCWARHLPHGLVGLLGD